MQRDAEQAPFRAEVDGEVQDDALDDALHYPLHLPGVLLQNEEVVVAEERNRAGRH
jgi:hypothetical protein